MTGSSRGKRAAVRDPAAERATWSTKKVLSWIEELVEDSRGRGTLELDLRLVQLERLPDVIFEADWLEELEIYRGRLRSLPAGIARLQRLRLLRINRSELETLPDSMGRLPGLRVLDVSNNRLKALPESIGFLGNLQELLLAENRLTHWPEAVASLRSLRSLDLSGNQLATLSSFVVDPQLEHLSLARNQLRTVPDEAFIHRNLRTLYLGGNKLTALGEWIGELSKLEVLSLGGNPLVRLPSSIARLANLRILEVSNASPITLRLGWSFSSGPCDLKELPTALRERPALTELYLQGQTALGLPPEVLGVSYPHVHLHDRKPANPRSILDYYFQLRVGKRPLSEVRLLLVGRGGAGKTSILRRLVDNEFSKRQRETKGIDIRPWSLGSAKKPIRAHVWDFAGQVITHATHQFFLSHRSVYVLVLTGREDSEKQDAEYWLRLIRAFGTERESGQTSPVIVALNKCKSAACKIDRNALLEKYPFIVDFVETDCDGDGYGIRRLKSVITAAIGKLAAVHEPFPEAWFRIKERLATMKEDHLSYAQFQEECRQLGESDAARQASLARVLHALGVALNYADDERLREATVLNPQWVTRGIYTLLRDATDDNGILSWPSVERVLPGEAPEMRRYLVELMRRFDLAFPLSEGARRWLVPQRLSPTQPKLSAEWQDADATRLRYGYTALPEGLMPRFITRTYPLSEGLPRWMNGVVLELDTARALVRADAAERRVEVSVNGPAAARQRLVGLIREDLQRIHGDIRGLEPLEEMELQSPAGEWIRPQTLEADEQARTTSHASTRTGTVSVDNTRELNRLSAPLARDPSRARRKAFISYSNKDARQFDQLMVALKPLRSEGLLETWSDRCLVAGQSWDRSIRQELEQADLIILLWSRQFEATDYVQDVEVARALERAKAGDAVVVSVILEQCGWARSPVAQFQVLPDKGQPVRDAKPQRNAWHAVGEGLRAALRSLPSSISGPARRRRGSAR